MGVLHEERIFGIDTTREIAENALSAFIYILDRRQSSILIGATPAMTGASARSPAAASRANACAAK